MSFDSNIGQKTFLKLKINSRFVFKISFSWTHHYEIWYFISKFLRPTIMDKIIWNGMPEKCQKRRKKKAMCEHVSKREVADNE